jgi:two-component system, sensor histidine kinase LadS
MMHRQRTVYDDAWEVIESGLLSASRMIRNPHEFRQVAEAALDVFEFRRQEAHLHPADAQAADTKEPDATDGTLPLDPWSGGLWPILPPLSGRVPDLRRSRDAVLTTVNHEFRTPLNGILGSLEGLKEELQEGEQRTAVEGALSAAKRLSQTLLCILRLSEIESGRIIPEMRPCNISTVLAKVTAQYAPRAEAKGIAIVAGDADTPCVISTDPGHLAEALGHIMDNAVKFSTRGSIRTSIRVMERDQTRMRDAEIVITDEGIGISAAKIGIVQQPFRQASEGYTRLYEGAGLGLTIARRLVELMHGSLRIETTEGKGTTIVVSFPAE